MNIHYILEFIKCLSSSDSSGANKSLIQVDLIFSLFYLRMMGIGCGEFFPELNVPVWLKKISTCFFHMFHRYIKTMSTNYKFGNTVSTIYSQVICSIVMSQITRGSRVRHPCATKAKLLGVGHGRVAALRCATLGGTGESAGPFGGVL